MKKANVVVIGGGTGLSNLLRGLKHFPLNISAIVSVADDGGSTGRLREDYDIPAPGDLRKVMVSLSKDEGLTEKLFQYRFNDGALKDHCLGNIMLAGMLDITGSMTQATKALSDLLNMCGEVIPVSNQSLELVARLDNGEIVKGESLIGKSIKAEGVKIETVFYEEPASASARAIKAIRNADFIIFGIGSLYTSIVPNLIIDGIRKEIAKSKVEKIYICNAMNQPGETIGYAASNYINVVESHLNSKIDTVIVNKNYEIPQDVMQRYIDDNVGIVEIDRQNLENYNLIEKDLLKIEDGFIRHNSLKLGMAIYSYILDKSLVV